MWQQQPAITVSGATEMRQDDILMTLGLSDHGSINPVIIMFIMPTSVWQQLKVWCLIMIWLLVWVWVWCSWMVICHKWWCLSCWRCLNGHVRIVVWTLTLCMTSSHHHYTASYLPPLFTFLVGRDIIRRPSTSHFHSPRISQEPLEGHSQDDRKILLETVYWPLS